MTVMYLYYNQPDAIKFFEDLGYPDIGIDFLFVDDGSKEPLKLDWATVLRIDEDVPWNQPKANNIGFKYLYSLAENMTVLRMDIDHYFTVNDLLDINTIKLFDKEIMTFKREGRHPHPNIYLANVRDMVKNGYDEQFCGSYGYDDIELMDRLKKKHFSFTSSYIKCYINHNIKQHGLERDTTVNKQKYLEKSNS